MTVVEQLKKRSMALRKERNPIAPSIQFALSEIEKVGKNSGNRETTEDEAIRVVQKLIATVDENLRVVEFDGHRIALYLEKQILQEVLPQMASEEEVRSLLADILGATAPKNKGVAMKVIRDEFGAKVDMKRAGEIVTEMYGI